MNEVHYAFTVTHAELTPHTYMDLSGILKKKMLQS